MSKIDFTIVIPAFKEERDLKTCLYSIASQDYSRERFEVILVDNYSTDSTVKVAKSFSKKIQIRVIKNKIKDAEVSKMLGFRKARGKFFMYLDADMCFATKNFITKMLFPFKNDKKICGNFVRFLPNKKHPNLTRALSYDEWQRDPIFRFFTVGIRDVFLKKENGYWLCKCDKDEVPPQGLMIYRKALIENYAKEKRQLIDNEIPAILVNQGNRHFAFVPSTGVYHLPLRSLKELSRKRIKNLERTYFPNKGERVFKWIDWRKNWPKIGIWLLYTNSFIFPILTALTKTLKHKDLCFLSEPALNMVSTYSIVYAVTRNFRKKNE